ncbi:MAG TPA: DUF222 domain-containing protein [Microbacterium sp.]|nr:DUF222 domain-containing protein [Microbacterium sp.]
MDTFGALIDQHVRSLIAMLGDVSVSDSAPVIARLGYDDVVAVIESASGAMAVLEGLRTVAAGAAARLSARDAGHSGLAQRRGHRSAISLVQELTGVSRMQAGKVTRLGQELLDTTAPAAGAGATVGCADPAGPPDGGQPDAGPRTWHACLGEAFTAGRISVDQQTAIRRGLGEPPDSGDAQIDADAVAAWAIAAEQLIDEASRRTVEDLGSAARTIRDQLDPEGAARRFHTQYEDRSFRMWADADGIRFAKIRFEPGGAAWAATVFDAALRPRRGGPRFVDPDERATGEELAADPRSNEQLAYDLLIDVLHAGALADAASVFGARQAGVRVVVSSKALDATREGLPGTATIEETATSVPATFAGQRICDSGGVECTVDDAGNPLKLGRTARLFSATQRLALAVRDGGCVWLGCDRPPSYCEAHHIDKYSEGGRTDLDRGVLLCAFHHMNLHHHGWWITRDGTGPFLLHSPDPDAPPSTLRPRLERRYLWGDLQPPSTRFRYAA